MSKTRKLNLVAFRKGLFNWWVVAEEGYTRQFLDGPFLRKSDAEREIESTFLQFEEMTGRKREKVETRE